MNKKITDNQKNALSLLNEVKSVSLDSNRLHKNTMNGLSFKGLVKLTRYANGEFWELTDKGTDLIKTYEQTG
jgi:predicted transcriptional regulator